RVSNVSLVASPAIATGPCPLRVAFHGEIQTEGRAGNVTYRFVRSDGAVSPTTTINFLRPGTVAVNDVWEVGRRSYSGGETLEVLAPQHVSSKRANFTVMCSSVASVVSDDTFTEVVDASTPPVSGGPVLVIVRECDRSRNVRPTGTIVIMDVGSR